MYIKLREGSVEFFLPKLSLECLSSKSPTFYNPNMIINRDFSILIIDFLKKSKGRKLKVLDPLAASGIRSLRFLLETDAIEQIVINDWSESAMKTIKKNIEFYKDKINAEVIIKKEDARILMLKEKKFDYIDIDPFGSPIPFIEPALNSVRNKGVIGITATDLSSLTGSKSRSCKRKYRVNCMRTDFMFEFGIRVLIKYVVEEGAKYDKALYPIFGYRYKHHYRVFFLVEKGAKKVDKLLEDIKSIYYCEKCGYRSIIKKYCPLCKRESHYLGPIWVGKIFDEKVMKFISKQIEKKNISDITKNVFELIKNESKFRSPWYFNIHILAKINKIRQLKPMKEYLEKFDGVLTHFDKNSIKTDIDPKEVIKLFKKIQ